MFNRSTGQKRPVTRDIHITITITITTTTTIIIIIIILVTTFTQGTYSYIPLTNHVFGVYNVTAILWL